MPRKPKSTFIYVLQVWFTSLIGAPVVSSLTLFVVTGRGAGVAETLGARFAAGIAISLLYFFLLCAIVPFIQRRPWRIGVKKSMVVVSLIVVIVGLSLLIGCLERDLEVLVFMPFLLSEFHLLIIIVAVFAYRWPGGGGAMTRIGR